jgi:hypothetical protein
MIHSNKAVRLEKRRLVEYYKIADKLHKSDSTPVVKYTYVETHINRLSYVRATTSLHYRPKIARFVTGSVLMFNV